MSTPEIASARAGPRLDPDSPGGQPGAARLRVESCRFGSVEVDAAHIVRFVCPIVGFEELSTYAMIVDEESEPVLWLQALGAPEVLFPVVDAGLVDETYTVDLTDEEVSSLGLDRAADAHLLLVLTLDPAPSAVTANLRAPIVWNTRRATAMQVVRQDPTLSVSHPVGGTGGKCRSNKEVARACPHTPQG